MFSRDDLRNNGDFQKAYAMHLLSTILNIRVDVAQRILDHFGHVRNLAKATERELMSIHGVGLVSARKILALTEWALLLEAAQTNQMRKIAMPGDLANTLMLEMGLLEREELRIVLLNTKNQVTEIRTVYQGNINTVVVRIAEILRPAVLANSPRVVLVHNHPSGDPTPSPEDVSVTELICDLGRQLDIDVVDHLVIGCDRFISLKERGLGF